MSAVRGASEAPETAEASEPSGRTTASYLEIEISRGRLNLFERQGDGKSALVVKALARYGLHLAERVSSPCG